MSDRTWLSPRRGLVWVLPAAASLVFANGRWQLAIAALAAPVFLRLFLITQPVARGLALGLVIQVAAYIIMWIGIIPAPGWLYYGIASAYALIYFLPFVIDRLTFSRLAGFSSTLVLPLAGFVTEILAQRLTPYGSWASPGYTQAGNSAFMQVTAVFGLAGVGFTILWFSSVLTWLFVSKAQSKTRIRYAVAGVWVGVLILGGGAIRLELADPPHRSVQVAMILPSAELSQQLSQMVHTSIGTQGDAPLNLERIRSLAGQLNEDLIQRSRREAESGAKIVVWSETAGRVLQQQEDNLLDRGRALAKATGIYLLMSLGTWRHEQDPPLENKIVVITPEGTIAWQYRKARPIVGSEAHLLPPPHDLLKTLETPYGRLSAGICHDLDFPDLIRQAGRQEVDLLFNPSADWEAITTIHARMAATRAIENGFTLVRPTDTGLSIVADPYGRLVAQSEDLALEGRSLSVQVPVYEARTPYPRIAGFLPWLASLALVGLILIAIRKDRA